MLMKYKCNICGNEIEKLFKVKAEVTPFMHCGECGGILEKQLPEFATSSVETVDTGVMQKRVELRKDATQKARQKGDNYIKMLESRDRIIKKDE